MQLYCTPAINLFPKRSDRVNLNPRDAEHLVVPDRMRPLDFEIFSVTSVEGFPRDGGPAQPFLPFYAANDLSRNPGHRSYYTVRRQPRSALVARPGAGTALELSRARRVRLPRRGDSAPVRTIAPARARPVVHEPRPADLDAGRQEAHRLHRRRERARASIRCLVGPTIPGRAAAKAITRGAHLDLGLNY